MKDAIGREWQLSTIQFDFNLPERFDLTYIGEDGQPHRPTWFTARCWAAWNASSACSSSTTPARSPVWLSPVQVALIPIADRHIDYAREIAVQLRKAGLRVMVDERAERMNAKIRDAQNQKIPYMLVIGDKEVENNQVALRLRSGENPGPIPISRLPGTSERGNKPKNLMGSCKIIQ